jgi:phosphoadenosine phosphosulfate reductase
MTVAASAESIVLASRLAAHFPALALAERLAAVRAAVEGRVVFTTSFGLEDQALAHVIYSHGISIDVVTIDTGRLFPETYDVWSATERRYATRIRGLSPERGEVEELVARQGIDGFRLSVEARKACCFVRKVEPLGRALDGANAWITGLRGDQSANRAEMRFAEFDAGHGVIKVNPLLDWPRERVDAFVRENAVPYNALHDRGFLSIGCAPCTRAVRPGEPERAGRWWWEQEDKKECGLHARPSHAAREPATAEGVN